MLQHSFNIRVCLCARILIFKGGNCVHAAENKTFSLSLNSAVLSAAALPRE